MTYYQYTSNLMIWFNLFSKGFIDIWRMIWMQLFLWIQASHHLTHYLIILPLLPINILNFLNLKIIFPQMKQVRFSLIFILVVFISTFKTTRLIRFIVILIFILTLRQSLLILRTWIAWIDIPNLNSSFIDNIFDWKLNIYYLAFLPKI